MEKADCPHELLVVDLEAAVEESLTVSLSVASRSGVA